MEKEMRIVFCILLGLALLLSTACAETGTQAADDSFRISEITDEIFERIQGKSFKDDCTLPREDLRYLHVLLNNPGDPGRNGRPRSGYLRV